MTVLGALRFDPREEDAPASRWHDRDQTVEARPDRSMVTVADDAGFRFRRRAAGVIPVLDPGWDAAAVEELLLRNGIADAGRTVSDFVPNGIVMDAESSFASLHRANHLAARDGVEMSNPDRLPEWVLG